MINFELITLEAGKHIYFRLHKLPKDTDKTLIYDIKAKKDNFILGQIKWFPRWRCYAFYPEPETVFEKTCMQDITDFIVKLIDQRKKK